MVKAGLTDPSARWFNLDNAANTIVESKAKTLPKGRETILIVEDEERILNLTKVVLESLEYSLVTATNADSALKILEGPNDIDCLFTDIIMPGKLNGHQLADWVKANQKSIKILFIESYTP